MTTKADFNASEWSTIVTAPALAAIYVSAADRGGSLRESLSASRAYASARANDAGPLMRDVLASPPSVDPGSRTTLVQQITQVAPAKLREAIATLERHTDDDEEVNAYKRFVYSVAEAVAHAHREGGFLGIGGSEVSEREQAALDEIGTIFDAPRSASAGALSAPAPRKRFTEDEARRIGEELGIDWAGAPFEVDQFRRGMDVELEHGRRDPATDVTGDDPTLTGKIALAHLNELADYYTRLERMEAEAERGAADA